MQKRVNKKGLSEVVTTLLFVLLALGAVVLVWVLVSSLLKNASNQVNLGSITLSYDIPAGKIYVNSPLQSISLIVARAAGTGDVAGLNVKLTDASGTAKTFRLNTVINELESSEVSVSYAGSGLGTPVKVEISPILKAADGSEQVGQIAASAAISSDEVHSKVLALDNLNEYASLAMLSGLSASAITVSAWVNVAQVSSWHDFIWGDWGSAGGWVLFTDSRVGFDISPQVGGIPYAPITSGQWHYVVGIYDGSNERVFVDGVEGSPSPVVESLKSSVSVRVGFDSNSGGGSLNDFNRELSDVRVYNRALSAAEIANLPNDNLGTISNGLVARWKLDGDLKDSSDKGNDLTATGFTATW